MAVTIPVKTTYDGKGFDQAERDAKRLQKEQLAATRAQIAEHRKVTQLTARLDRDLAATQQARIQQYKDLGAAAATAGGVLVAYSVDAVANAREAMAAEAQLAATIESTGGAAGQSLEALTAHASALQDISNFSDDAIMDGQGLLLTFTNIKDVFPEATQTMLDMSTAMDQDLKSSALQLGKALNDPVNGISALTRAGVQFTDAQKEQIKAMVEMGDVAGAQRIILEELNREFGGSAAAAREALGAQQDLNVATGELSEAWGKLLLAVGDAGVTGALVKFIETLTEGAEAWTGAVEQAQILKEALDEVTIGFNGNWEALQKMIKGLADANPFVILSKSVKGFYDTLKEGGAVFDAWKTGIGEMLAPAADFVGGGLGAFTNIGQTMQAAPAPAPVSRPAPRSNSIYGFADGGAFTVGGAGGTDSQLVQFLATPGEKVSITPPGQGGPNVTVNVLGPGGKELAAIMQRYAEMAVQEYHDTIITPWSNGV